MIVIGFTGKKQNGKSTVCDMIQSNFFKAGISSARINFKDPLLEAARRLGWNGIKDERGRKLLQRLGTDVVRECIDQDYWVNAWKRKIADLNQAHEKIVLADDVRFDNEAAAVRELSGRVIFIETPTANEKQGHDAHASESGIRQSLIDMRFDEVEFGLGFLQKIADDVSKRVIAPAIL